MRPRLSIPSVLVVSGLLLIGFLFLAGGATSQFVGVLGVVVLFGLTISAAIDLYAVVTGKETIGDGIQRTTRRFGLYRTGISLLLGAMLGHFFWPTPP